MVSLDKFIGSFNVVDDLSSKICVPSARKDIKVQVLNLMTRINE